MAKKETIIRTTEQVPDGDEIPVSEELTADEINLAAIRERFAPAGATYKIYKIVKGANPAWCFDSIDEIDESSIQSAYGGGRYAIRIFIMGKLRDTVYIDIAEPAITRGLGTSNNPADPMQLMVTMMQKQLSDQQNMIMAFIGRPQQPAAQGTTFADTIALVKLLKDEQPLTSNGIVSKIVEKALDNMGGDGAGDWKTELIKGVKEIVPPVASAFLAMNMPKPGPGMGVAPGVPSIAPGQVDSSTTVAPIEQIPTITPENQEVLEALVIKQAIGMVKPKVLGGVLDPALAAEWLLANAGDPMYQPLVKWALTKPVDEFVKVDPEVGNAPYKEWFEKFLLETKEMYAQGAEDHK